VRDGRERAQTITRRQAALGAVAALGAAGAAKLIYDQMYTDEPEPGPAKSDPVVAPKADTTVTTALTELTTVPATALPAAVAQKLDLTGDAAAIVVYLICARNLAGTSSTLGWLAAGIAAYNETSKITKLAAVVVLFACVVGDAGLLDFPAILATCLAESAGNRGACTDACVAPFQFATRVYDAKRKALGHAPTYADFSPTRPEDRAFLAAMGAIAGKCAGYMWRDDTGDTRTLIITAILVAMATRKTILAACTYVIRWYRGPAAGAAIAPSIGPSGAPGFTSAGWSSAATLQRGRDELRDIMALVARKTHEWVSPQIFVQFLLIMRILIFVVIQMNTFLGRLTGARLPTVLTDSLTAQKGRIDAKMQALSNRQVAMATVTVILCVPIFLKLFPYAQYVTYSALASASAEQQAHANGTSTIQAAESDAGMISRLFQAIVTGISGARFVNASQALGTDADASTGGQSQDDPTQEQAGTDPAAATGSATLADQIFGYMGELRANGAPIQDGQARNESLCVRTPYYTNLAGLPEYSAGGEARVDPSAARLMQELADEGTSSVVTQLIGWIHTLRPDTRDASIILQHKAVKTIEWMLGWTPTIVSDAVVLNLHNLSSSIAATARAPSAANKGNLKAAFAPFADYQCAPEISQDRQTAPCIAINVALALIALDKPGILATRIFTAFDLWLKADETAVTRDPDSVPHYAYQYERHIKYATQLLDKFKRATNMEGNPATVLAAANKLHHAQSATAADATEALSYIEGRFLWQLDISSHHKHVKL
jgi:hypothetical protein